MATESKGTILLIPKFAIGHEPWPVPFASHPRILLR